MITLAVPAWAERITVERDGEQLIVRGEGRTGLATRQGMTSQNDLLWQYAQFTKPWTGKDRTGTRLPHIQFANAITDEDLVGFVRRFGPLLASVSSLSDRNPVVNQDLRVLRRELSAVADDRKPAAADELDRPRPASARPRGVGQAG